jgi:hypothetical protein
MPLEVRGRASKIVVTLRRPPSPIPAWPLVAAPPALRPNRSEHLVLREAGMQADIEQTAPLRA